MEILIGMTILLNAVDLMVSWLIVQHVRLSVRNRDNRVVRVQDWLRLNWWPIVWRRVMEGFGRRLVHWLHLGNVLGSFVDRLMVRSFIDGLRWLIDRLMVRRLIDRLMVRRLIDGLMVWRLIDRLMVRRFIDSFMVKRLIDRVMVRRLIGGFMVRRVIVKVWLGVNRLMVVLASDVVMVDPTLYTVHSVITLVERLRDIRWS